MDHDGRKCSVVNELRIANQRLLSVSMSIHFADRIPYRFGERLNETRHQLLRTTLPLRIHVVENISYKDAYFISIL